MRTQLLCALALILISSACEARTFYGMASWYGPGFEGRKMANGRIFRTLRETAAMRLVPLGSLVRVTNLDNGRWMLVLITDRGPYRPGRIIDLSMACAYQLGMLHSGVARVRVEEVYAPTQEGASVARRKAKGTAAHTSEQRHRSGLRGKARPSHRRDAP